MKRQEEKVRKKRRRKESGRWETLSGGVKMVTVYTLTFENLDEESAKDKRFVLCNNRKKPFYTVQRSEKKNLNGQKVVVHSIK